MRTKQKIVSVFFTISALVIFLSLTTINGGDIGAEKTVALFDKNQKLFASSVETLYAVLQSMDQDTTSVLKARTCLRECRMRYKDIAFFTSYFFPSETLMYNAAPNYEVEEPELELVEPMGLQQIEALLFEDDVFGNKTELLAQADALYTSAKDLSSLLYQFTANDKQVLESIRMELIRMITLYITGYDAPSLKTGISETLETSKIIQTVLQPYFQQGQDHSKTVAEILQRSIQYLDAHQEFDSFDRMEYLLKYALPLQEQLGLFIKREKLELNTMAYLNEYAANLFSPDFLKPWDSIPEADRPGLAALGKKLFFDKALSGNLTVSCATCHQPENYFTDGRIKSPSIVADSVLKRNTPTLMYSGRQHLQFWDGRSKNLVEQVKTVIFNPLEMAGKSALLYRNIIQDTAYKQAFKTLFPGKKAGEGYMDEIALALSAYVAGLNPFSAAFDRYMAGDKQAMTTDQVKGFNLFMGKGQCATCHFAPYFNSLVPPLYDVSELEIIGTTKNDQLETPEYDTDMGRFDLYQIRYYKQAFKTPTVRNAEKTAPYMHNGSFKTLESVLDFYNKGGGNGLGLTIEDQTLSSKPLNLSQEECSQIIRFIHSLTDSNVT